MFCADAETEYAIWVWAHQYSHVYKRWLCILHNHGERISVISVSECEWTKGYLNTDIETEIVITMCCKNILSKYTYM